MNGGGVVLDTFLGSGTTCLAAKQLGRQWIGFELNPEFYQIALDRMQGIDENGGINLLDSAEENNYIQGSLFGDEEEDE